MTTSLIENILNLLTGYRLVRKELMSNKVTWHIERKEQ